MNNRSDISVAMATYNGALYLEQQLYSVVNQSLLPKEIIIVDDCSTDETIDVVKEMQCRYPIIRYYVNDENLGPVKTFKRSISLCEGDYVALCDQDDIWESDKLLLSFCELKDIQEMNKPSAVYSDLKIIDFKGNLKELSFWDIQGFNPNKIDFRSLLVNNIVTGCTVLMNSKMKDLLEDMPDNILMHDHWIALISYGLGSVRGIQDKPIRYRMHENSVTRKSRLSFFERLQMLFKAFAAPDGMYLEGNIYQAKEFYSLYKNQLSLEKIKVLESFLNLEKKSIMFRKCYVRYILNTTTKR